MRVCAASPEVPAHTQVDVFGSVNIHSPILATRIKFLNIKIVVIIAFSILINRCMFNCKLIARFSDLFLWDSDHSMWLCHVLT